MLPQTLLNIFSALCRLSSVSGKTEDFNWVVARDGLTIASVWSNPALSKLTDLVGVLVGVTAVEEAPLPIGWISWRRKNRGHSSRLCENLGGSLKCYLWRWQWHRRRCGTQEALRQQYDKERLYQRQVMAMKLGLAIAYKLPMNVLRKKK